MLQTDVVIRGAGVAGRSLALELRRRGKSVLLLKQPLPGAASQAAAGMLAACDPHNPPALQPLADLALDMYPAFLRRLRELTGNTVHVQSRYVLEPHPESVPGHSLLPAIAPEAGNFALRAEESVDPRELLATLTAACAAAGVIEQDTSAPDLQADLECNQFVDCTGAWSPFVRPAKGQMLRVKLPEDTLCLPNRSAAVVRTADVYLVPRLDGSTLIGATVEDAGFDLTIQPSALQHLREKAAAILPAAAKAPEIASWAGLRPRTADDLPVLGESSPNHFVLNGLFRNGILLAPAAARVMAQVLCGETPAMDLTPYSPSRASLAVIAQP